MRLSIKKTFIDSYEYFTQRIGLNLNSIDDF